jgi:hypothetical protein
VLRDIARRGPVCVCVWVVNVWRALVCCPQPACGLPARLCSWAFRVWLAPASDVRACRRVCVCLHVSAGRRRAPTTHTASKRCVIRYTDEVQWDEMHVVGGRKGVGGRLAGGAQLVPGAVSE